MKKKHILICLKQGADLTIEETDFSEYVIYSWSENHLNGLV